jgi:hypothetical protein
MDSSDFQGNLQLFEDWLGGLDSNQDNQIQNLMYCQLYDLPAEGETTKKAANARPASTLLADNRFVNGEHAIGSYKLPATGS